MARKKVVKPPPGFDITAAVRAESAIREKLSIASSKLPGSRVIVFVYKDGSIDGELAVGVPRGISVDELTDDMQRSLGGFGLTGGIWVSMGVRYTIQKDEEVYRKYKGMNEVGVNYQLAKQTNIAEEFLILRNKVGKGMKKKYRRKATMVFMRFHWNPSHKQPTRY